MQSHRQPRGAYGFAAPGEFAVTCLPVPGCDSALLTGPAACVRYGVSRVYNQQCGYTLLDVQAMHDKMLSMLKVMPGGGLDPTAGKIK